MLLREVLVYPCHSNAHIGFNFIPIDARLAFYLSPVDVNIRGQGVTNRSWVAMDGVAHEFDCPACRSTLSGGRGVVGCSHVV